MAECDRDKYMDATHVRGWCRNGCYKKVEEFITRCNDLPSLLLSRAGSCTFSHAILHEAVHNHHPKVVELLLHHAGGGEHVDSRSAGGYTPLHIAAGNGDVHSARVLLAYNADTTIKDDFGRTALQTAQLCRKHAVVELLQNGGECISTS
ncbi:serine/threonine-protein phosphatase 6 regulatory ankyrin repeat subunit C-like [Dysidea avara]|uniref:serine/threonine-protein phosphatase 6 regulatory ankyrin repeat subunit C-like n=1 Tax=Dysidea avara TaxID=196820 RepID=UPI003331D409